MLSHSLNSMMFVLPIISHHVHYHHSQYKTIQIHIWGAPLRIIFWFFWVGVRFLMAIRALELSILGLEYLFKA